MTRAITVTSVFVLGCVMVPSQPISIASSRDQVQIGCDLVGEFSIGLTDPPVESTNEGTRSRSGTSPEELEPDLLDWAKDIARDWDGDVLLFRTIVEKPPESAVPPTLWCECEVYRCAAGSIEEPKEVPLVALLADPDSYEGQLVLVSAWAAVEHESTALFLNAEDMSHGAFATAIGLNGPEPLFAGLPFPYFGYLEVVGRFSREASSPHFRGYLAVHRLRRLDPYPTE